MLTEEVKEARDHKEEHSYWTSILSWLTTMSCLGNSEQRWSYKEIDWILTENKTWDQKTTNEVTVK